MWLLHISKHSFENKRNYRAWDLIKFNIIWHNFLNQISIIRIINLIFNWMFEWKILHTSMFSNILKTVKDFQNNSMRF